MTVWRERISDHSLQEAFCAAGHLPVCPLVDADPPESVRLSHCTRSSSASFSAPSHRFFFSEKVSAQPSGKGRRV